MKKISMYDFSSKNHWRRAVWNYFKEGMDSKGYIPKKSIGLYLGTSECLDVAVARAKGFRAENMVGVSWEKKECRHMRKDGLDAFRSDLGMALLNWNSEKFGKIRFINADFCGGLKNAQMRFLEFLICSQSVDTHCFVALNLKHGRDKESNWLREQIEECIEISPFARDWFTSQRFMKNEALHRGKVAMFYLALMFCIHAHPQIDSKTLSKGINPFMNECFKEWRPVFGQYRSEKSEKTKKGNKKSVEYFDWCLFKWRATNIGLDTSSATKKFQTELAKSKAQYAAGMAHRTRRMSA